MIHLLPGKRVKFSALLLTTFSLVAAALNAAPQIRGLATQAAGTPRPSFEVVSIKLCKSPTLLDPSIDGRAALGIAHVPGIHLFNGRFNATSSALGLILWAYGTDMRPLSGGQVTGAEGWIHSDLYDIEAKVDDSLIEGEWKDLPFEQKKARAMQMVQTMLAERFRLQISHVMQERPVYDLVVARNGPKFKEDDAHIDMNLMTGHGAVLEATSIKISSLAGLLGTWPELRDRVVLDKTGLTGHYSFTFEWKRQPPPNIAGPSADSPPPESSGPSLFTALQEQLGLKLVPAKAPVDILVIDHIERPTEN